MDSITIICKKCHTKKGIEFFYKTNKSTCKDCLRAVYRSPEAKQRDVLRRLKKKHDIKVSEQNKERCARYREKHRDEIKARARERYKVNPRRVKNPDRLKIRSRKYNITKEDLVVMLQNQKGCCFICDEKLGEKLFIDHDHKTGKVRKLLCKHCNTALGFVKDNPETLRKLANYIELHKGE